MATRVAIHHQTSSLYDRPVTLGPHLIRLRPSAGARTPIYSYSLDVIPPSRILHWQQDPYGNLIARSVFPERTREFTVSVDLVADVSPMNPFDHLLEPEAQNYPFTYSSALARDLELYLSVPPPGPALSRLLSEVPRANSSTMSFVVDLNKLITRQISYRVRLEPGLQTSEETLCLGTGSCRDSAWLLVETCRHLGLAARFVSGYLIQLAEGQPPPGAPAQDSIALHAWAEVYLPGAGWIGLDATSGLLAAEGHIPLACVPEPAAAAPIEGTAESSGAEFRYSMTIQRLSNTEPLSLTYSDAEWGRLEQVARSVDTDLAVNDVRLTMGGEPTFVGIDEPESPQWNGDAMGALKRNRAVALIRSLQERLAPGALLHFGQGKWYPGEALPRWALGCYWRADGIPLWDNGRLIAQEDQDYELPDSAAERFLAALARRLQVSPENILPAYEDALFYIWKERRLPINVDVFDSKLADSRQRAELARVFERGLDKPVGYVLPLRRRRHQDCSYWSSQLWFLRPERLLLMQGDSPIGYRLPLDSLPWVSPDQAEYEYEEDPFAADGPLPVRHAPRFDLFDEQAPADPLPSEPVGEAENKSAVRPALCVEAREGRLHVFLPYLVKLPAYLDLLAAVEDTCLYLNQPVWLEGYPPPSDPRLRSFSVTPDPGVIEVNLPAASNWDELKHIYTVVFEEARRARLTAEKFGFDGRHSATGGGSHIVLGGPSPADSPLLRRPALLRSIVTFWQAHPSLSFLFSGAFIGPTSQYARIDEARMDALYELQIAFEQLPQGECPPWLVDRLFRNLLVDMTGNTHRVELCIDKLYPPEGSGSRLGLLELRAFEMAPDVRMSLAELLLVRALVAAFWNHPYEGNLASWGTALHDRFMLPWFVEQDFQEVLSFLQRSGYPFELSWFRPHLDFRFPLIGSMAAAGVELELRQALEPWHVLGEEAGASGMSRSVDSSLERIQVKVAGITERCIVVCNGRKVPLHSLGPPGEAVAGVRFRAWKLVNCLHPIMGVQTPLRFEIIDRWSGRSLGGCAYHILHPAGHIYPDRPADAAEARQRRAARFEQTGPTFGPVLVPADESNPTLPMTLDLRWHAVTPRGFQAPPKP